MTPGAAIKAFGYLRAVQAGDTEAAAGFADADPQMPALLVDVTERIIVPVTALCGLDPDPCDDSVALEAVGRVLVATLRNWSVVAGPGTTEGIARAVIGFVAHILTQEDREDVSDVLRELEAVGVGQALEAHPAPDGSRPVLVVGVARADRSAVIIRPRPTGRV
ncbi:hypothetical protein [Streptomyces sp. B1I3]|uniref:hypothetical protein n=1 Tax=Streptomyces sp. B1I3 TaxID=3042264 RepID=UPI0027828A4D|nr:hypothetical protein [Streptomyces sp. B1I3]MDQ0798245.1 hypothetical protein [Streptomyces sp. B1I3]